LIGGLEDEKALAEIRHLDDHGLAGQIQDAEAVDEVLARAGDVALAGLVIACQHGEVIDRRDGSDAADEESLGLDPALRPMAVVDVHQRPAPEIGEATDRAHEIGRES
jgi:hypothetical protein